jgi:hypothetical protein
MLEIFSILLEIKSSRNTIVATPMHFGIKKNQLKESISDGERVILCMRNICKCYSGRNSD